MTEEEQTTTEEEQAPEPVSDRPVFEYSGAFTPSSLAQHLTDSAGIACLGVTYTDETDGIFTVQVICEVDTAQADVDRAVSSYAPPAN